MQILPSESVVATPFRVPELELVSLKKHSHQPMDAWRWLDSPILLLQFPAVFLLEKQLVNVEEGGLEEDLDLCGGVVAEGALSDFAAGFMAYRFLHAGCCNAKELF
jgi:hypothetical protein